MDKSTFSKIYGLGERYYEALKTTDDAQAFEEYESLMNKNIRIVHLESSEYPLRLLEVMGSVAPAVLFCAGRHTLLNSDSIAVVGSRNTSQQGYQIACQLAGELALAGINIVSGYARGIDTGALMGALKKDGTATFVLPFGILNFKRKEIFNDVHWEGNVLVVSQFHPSEVWRARNAMTRNKLVCGLSKAVVVVEAGEEGGTLHAGKSAIDMKIPVFVVNPGVFGHSPAGNKELLSFGAMAIEPRDAVATIMQYLRKQVGIHKRDVAQGLQNTLFNGNSGGN